MPGDIEYEAAPQTTIREDLTGSIADVTGYANNNMGNYVGVAPGVQVDVVAANTRRKYLLIKNVSDVQIYIGLDPIFKAIPGNGWPLNPGEKLELSKRYGNLYLGVVSAFNSAGVMKWLAVLELG